MELNTTHDGLPKVSPLLRFDVTTLKPENKEKFNSAQRQLDTEKIHDAMALITTVIENEEKQKFLSTYSPDATQEEITEKQLVYGLFDRILKRQKPYANLVDLAATAVAEEKATIEMIRNPLLETILAQALEGELLKPEQCAQFGIQFKTTTA